MQKKDAPCCSSALGTPIPDNECKQNTSKGCIPYAPALSAFILAFQGRRGRNIRFALSLRFYYASPSFKMLSKNITRRFLFANRIFPISSKIAEIHPSVFLHPGIGVSRTD